MKIFTYPSTRLFTGSSILGAGKFPIQKWGIFLQGQGKQVIPQIDTEIVKKSHLWMETM